MSAVVRLEEVWKRFHLHRDRSNSLKDMFSSLLLRNRRPENDEFWALKGVSFEIRQGQTFGIIGPNGSGKSTLLKLLTGIMRPTRGHLAVNGKVSALIEVGAGFHPDLTGRENVFLNGSILGMRKAEIASRFDEIVGFAELEQFIDTPVKYYSSGMYMRLGFAIAVHVDPEILLVDEVLAVGDERFQRRCLAKMSEFQQAGKTIVFVSHSLNQVNQICDTVLLLEKGSIMSIGPTSGVVEEYQKTVDDKEGICVIKEYPAAITFNNGRFFLSWNGVYLTISESGHTVVSSENRRYNSLDATWTIDKADKTRMTVTGKWRQLPISQTWEFELVNGRELRWRIHMGAQERIKVEHIMFYLMLKDKYCGWFSSTGNSGKFPQAFDEIAWQKSFVTELQEGHIGALTDLNESTRFPKIMYSLARSSATYESVVSTTSITQRARVLSYSRVNEEWDSFLEPGTMLWFDGKITLGEEDSSTETPRLSGEERR